MICVLPLKSELRPSRSFKQRLSRSLPGKTLCSCIAQHPRPVQISIPPESLAADFLHLPSNPPRQPDRRREMWLHNQTSKHCFDKKKGRKSHLFKTLKCRYLYQIDLSFFLFSDLILVAASHFCRFLQKDGVEMMIKQNV